MYVTFLSTLSFLRINLFSNWNWKNGNLILGVSISLFFLQVLKKDIPFGTELIDECEKKLPCYKINMEAVDDNMISIRITQNNFRYMAESRRDDALLLLVGDSCNRLILYDNM